LVHQSASRRQARECTVPSILHAETNAILLRPEPGGRDQPKQACRTNLARPPDAVAHKLEAIPMALPCHQPTLVSSAGSS